MLYNKVEEELNQANDSCDTKKDYTQQKIAELRTVLKERKRKQVDSILKVQTDSLFVKKYVIMAVEGRSESRNWKWNNSSTRSGITNQISCSKDTENRTANADYAHNAKRQETTLHQWAQYWQQNNI